MQTRQMAEQITADQVAIRQLTAERDAARNMAERRLQERESWAATAQEHAKAADRLAAENAQLREALKVEQEAHAVSARERNRFASEAR